MFDFSYYIKIFIALAVLVNPIEGIPIFITNTKESTREQKIYIARKTSAAVFIILIVALFFGRYLLELFGISTSSFSLAGGVIIFIIALQMVLGKSDSGEKSLPEGPAQDNSDIAIVPLAIPLLAGPGAISSIIVYGSKSTGIVEDIILSGVVLLIAFYILFSLSATTRLEKVLNPTRVKIITKISGLLVAAIAVELIYGGIVNLVKLHSE